MRRKNLSDNIQSYVLNWLAEREHGRGPKMRISGTWTLWEDRLGWELWLDAASDAWDKRMPKVKGENLKTKFHLYFVLGQTIEELNTLDVNINFVTNPASSLIHRAGELKQRTSCVWLVPETLWFWDCSLVCPCWFWSLSGTLCPLLPIVGTWCSLWDGPARHFSILSYSLEFPAPINSLP